MSKDKIFYRFIIKHFKQQLHRYFEARIPATRLGVGDTLPMNKWSYVVGGNRVDAKGVVHGSTKEKHYNIGWNACLAEMKTRIL